MRKRIDAAVIRHNLLLLMLSVIIVAGAVMIAARTSIPYFSAKFGDGTTFLAEQVARYSGELPVYFAHVDGSAIADIGVYREKRRLGVLVVDDRLLLVELPREISATRTSYTGTLYPLPQEYSNEIIPGLEGDNVETNGSFLPFYLDVRDAESSWWYLGVIALFIPTVIYGYGLILAVMRFLRPKRHPYWKRLRRYNNDVEQLLQSIDDEMLVSSREIGNLLMTRNWIIQDHFLNFNLMRITDVVWLYMDVQKTSMYFVPIHKVVTAFIWDQYGVDIRARANAKQVTKILETVAFRAHWAMFGYLPELQKIWKKDRAGFVGEVMKRKAASVQLAEE